MKQFALGGFVIVLLLINFAALDDITTGKESSHTVEYLFLIGSVFIFLIIAYHYLKRKHQKKRVHT